MSFSIVPKTPFSDALTSAETSVATVPEGKQAEDVYQQGLTHLVAQRMQAAKTAHAVSLAQDLYAHAMNTSSELLQESDKLLKEARSPQVQTQYESLSTELTDQFARHVKGTLEVGMTAIAREVHKEVIVPKPEKKGWFK
jgi:hypothetical protein